MRYGAVDIGTNSCRMLIAESKDDCVYKIKQQLEITRLGEGVDQNRILAKEAIERSAAVVQKFYEVMTKSGVEKIAIVGTSALRDVNNTRLLEEKIKAITGTDLKIISGKKEARLNYLGAGIDTEKEFVLIDIGGGSTEFVWQEEGNIVFRSLDVGAVRMTERHIKSTILPIPVDELSQIAEDIAANINDNINNIGKLENAVGVGGTITTIAAIESQLTKYDSDIIHNYQLSYDRIKQILNKLAQLTLAERKQVTGLQPGRADIIVAGIKILQVIMQELKIEQITVSDHDLLFGIIKDLHN
ncbi:MAG: Ppx/GppA family phosphatase [Halothermotrichaceae bacterium]